MLRENSGTIILFSGGGAAYARPHFSAYGASKTGVLRLVETVHEEVLEHQRIAAETRDAVIEAGIRIYAVAPGAVSTKMTEEVLESKDQAGGKAYEEALHTKQEGGTSPEKAAALCLYLSTARPACLSGRLIHANEPYQNYVTMLQNDQGSSAQNEKGFLRRVPFKK